MQEVFQQTSVQLTYTPTYNQQSNSVERTHRDLNTMLHVLCHQQAADWEEVLPAALLALRSAVHESTGVTPFACLYGREPATPLNLVSKIPGAPLAAHTYVRRLEDHQIQAHRTVQVQLARALQRTSRRYGDEKDAIQPGERVWLFTSKPAADRKLAIPYSGPWRVTKQLSGTLRTIRPEGDWCRQPKDITVSLNQLKRYHGEACAPRRVDYDLRQLEDAEDCAEGPMWNTWITDEGAAATQALNQEAGDVHAPSLREKTTASVTPQPAPRLFSRHRDVEDMAPSIVVHHEHSATGEPGSATATAEPTPKVDSTTMTGPGLSTPATPTRDPSGTWPAPRTQQSFDKSAQHPGWGPGGGWDPRDGWWLKTSSSNSSETGGRSTSSGSRTWLLQGRTWALLSNDSWSFRNLACSSNPTVVRQERPGAPLQQPSPWTRGSTPAARFRGVRRWRLQFFNSKGEKFRIIFFTFFFVFPRYHKRGGMAADEVSMRKGTSMGKFPRNLLHEFAFSQPHNPRGGNWTKNQELLRSMLLSPLVMSALCHSFPSCVWKVPCKKLVCKITENGIDCRIFLHLIQVVFFCVDLTLIRKPPSSVVRWHLQTTACKAGPVHYVDLVDWKSMNQIFEPPIKRKCSNEDLLAQIDNPERRLQVPDVPYHSQSLERHVKLLTEVSSREYGLRNRYHEILNTLQSRKEMPKFGNNRMFPLNDA